MVSSTRKRGRQEMEAESSPAPATPPKTAATPQKEHGLLYQLRNMWQFANVGQFIFTFAEPLKLQNFDIEDLEMESLKPGAPKLKEIGLAFLKFATWQRGLSLDNFDDITRKLFAAHTRGPNPFGTNEDPVHFNDFDVKTKIKALQTLSALTMRNPDRLRELMDATKEKSDQTYWRVEPYGWDSEDRTYIVLDDNRVYLVTDAPPSPKAKAVPRTPKKNSKKARAALRASKRRKFADGAVDAEDVEPEEDAPDEDATKPDEPEEDDGLGGQKWECLAITLDELYTLISSLTSRDENEKNLRSRLAKHLVPIFEEYEASRKRKLAQKEKELLNMEKMQHAKRSSRLASKMEHKREEEERRAAEEKHRQELAMAKKEQQKWQKLEKERESRMQTREQRLKEREARRILHEEELATLSENGKKLHEGEAGRLSERNLKAAIDKNRRALMELENVDEDWVFDCICGAYGQVDDGSLSVECEKCKVWQHAKCIGVTKAQVNNDDYHFVCSTCKRKEKEAEEAKIKPHITLKVNHPPSSPSKLHASLPVMNGSPVKRPLELASPIKQQEQRNIQSSPTRSPYDAYQASRTILPPIKYANGQNGDIVRPVSQGSTPVAPQWSNQANGHGQGQTPARLQLGSHLQRQSPFSSPHPLSPTSLPPPFPQYGFGNGNGVGQPPVGQFVAPPSSPAPGASQNGHGHGVGGGYQQQFQVSRRTSVSFPSPLAGAPIITGTTNRNRMEPNAPSGQILPPINATPSRPPSNPASSYTTPAHAVQTPQAPYSTASNGMLHFAAGISPVKHSPPLRPLTAERNANVSGSFNSSFGGNLCTPTQIPPAAKLNPSPRIIDNTPPIKQAPRFVSGPVAVPKGDSAPGGVIAGNSLGDPLPAFAGLGQTGQAGQVGQGAQNGGAQAPVQGQ